VKGVEAADQVAADLVLNCYGKLGVLSAVIRIDGDNLRLIAPDGHYEALAMLLYRAADECAAHAKPAEKAWKPDKS
jgi:hypothetical protein